jgi:hypothetical protein
MSTFMFSHSFTLRQCFVVALLCAFIYGNFNFPKKRKNFIAMAAKRPQYQFHERYATNMKEEIANQVGSEMMMTGKR